MPQRFGLQIILIAALLLVIGTAEAEWRGAPAPGEPLRLAQAFDKDQFMRERPQLPPTQEPEQRAPLPAPVAPECAIGLRMGPDGCVLDTPPPSATKYGAIAVGTKSNTWYGVAWDRDDEESARSAAMDSCMNQARKRRSTNCRVVHTFSDACVAMAWLNAGTGWGTAVRNTKSEAESAALTQCYKANPRRRCVLAGSWCNGT